MCACGVPVQLIESRHDVEHRDEVIVELRSACESSKAAEMHAGSMLQSATQKLDEYAAAFGDVEGAAGRSELTIVTLQQQARDSQQRIVELESLHRCVYVTCMELEALDSCFFYVTPIISHHHMIHCKTHTHKHTPV